MTVSSVPLGVIGQCDHSGYAARCAGVDRHYNPYSRDLPAVKALDSKSRSQLEDAWWQGWDRASKEVAWTSNGSDESD